MSFILPSCLPVPFIFPSGIKWFKPSLFFPSFSYANKWAQQSNHFNSSVYLFYCLVVQKTELHVLCRAEVLLSGLHPDSTFPAGRPWAPNITSLSFVHKWQGQRYSSHSIPVKIRWNDTVEMLISEKHSVTIMHYFYTQVLYCKRYMSSDCFAKWLSKSNTYFYQVNHINIQHGILLFYKK